MTYNIQPVSVGAGLQTATASKVSFGASYVPFGKVMDFTYALLDSNGKAIYQGLDSLGEDILAGWGSDDQYIINAMASKIGVTLV